MNNSELIKNYATKSYRNMFREPDGQLKHKFIVPGSVYNNCLWDWDSWLTDIALHQFADGDIVDYEKGCVINFLEHIREDGVIPIVITAMREMPAHGAETNSHKPCFAQHAAFVIKNNGGDAEWLRPKFGDMQRYIDYYINNCRHG